MLLNKIPVLDKGYVALLDTSMVTSKLKDIGQGVYGGEYPVALEELGSLTLLIKCPLFVQLALSKYQFKVVDANDGTLDAYKPNSGEVGARERLDSEAIADDISRTTDALLLNPRAYQADGCNRFMSQIITPLNTYTTIIVQGNYSQWTSFAYKADSLPVPIGAYCGAIQQIIEAEWR